MAKIGTTVDVVNDDTEYETDSVLSEETHYESDTEEDRWGPYQKPAPGTKDIVWDADAVGGNQKKTALPMAKAVAAKRSFVTSMVQHAPGAPFKFTITPADDKKVTVDFNGGFVLDRFSDEAKRLCLVLPLSKKMRASPSTPVTHVVQNFIRFKPPAPAAISSEDSTQQSTGQSSTDDPSISTVALLGAISSPDDSDLCPRFLFKQHEVLAGDVNGKINGYNTNVHLVRVFRKTPTLEDGAVTEVQQNHTAFRKIIYKKGQPELILLISTARIGWVDFFPFKGSENDFISLDSKEQSWLLLLIRGILKGGVVVDSPKIYNVEDDPSKVKRSIQLITHMVGGIKQYSLVYENSGLIGRIKNIDLQFWYRVLNTLASLKSLADTTGLQERLPKCFREQILLEFFFLLNDDLEKLCGKTLSEKRQDPELLRRLSKFQSMDVPFEWFLSVVGVKEWSRWKFDEHISSVSFKDSIRNNLEFKGLRNLWVYNCLGFVFLKAHMMH